MDAGRAGCSGGRVSVALKVGHHSRGGFTRTEVDRGAESRRLLPGRGRLDDPQGPKPVPTPRPPSPGESRRTDRDPERETTGSSPVLSGRRQCRNSLAAWRRMSPSTPVGAPGPDETGPSHTPDDGPGESHSERAEGESRGAGTDRCVHAPAPPRGPRTHVPRRTLCRALRGERGVEVDQRELSGDSPPYAP